MARNTFLSWSTTANDNTDVAGINIAEGCPPSNLNNSDRAIMAILRRDIDNGTVLATKSGDYLLLAADNNGIFRFTATATASLTAAATLATNWHATIVADGGDVTIDPNASETVDGLATLVIPNGYSALVFCNGTAFFTDKLATTLSQRAPKGHINGLVLTNNGSDATNDIDIAAGEAASDGTAPYLMTLASAMTKRLDAGWSVGNNQGGLDTGSVGNNVYYVWEIQRSDTGVTDACYSLSNTSPTFGGNIPVAYDRKRVIGSFARVGGVNNAPRSYSQDVTNWVAWTPVFTGVGTVSAALARSRRVGAVLDVEVTWTNGTPPTGGSAVTFGMTLGFNGVNANVAVDSYWNIRRPVLGNVLWQTAAAISLYGLGLGSSNVINIGIASSTRSALDPVNGDVLGVSAVLMARFSIPIEGWN